MAHKDGVHVWGVELSEAVYQTAVALTALVGYTTRCSLPRGVLSRSRLRTEPSTSW